MEREDQTSGPGQEADSQGEMPHEHQGSDRPGGQVGVGTGGLGGQEQGGRREESSGQGDEESPDSDG